MYWGGSSFNQSSEDQLPATYSGGDWTLSFPAGNFPADGGYTVRVYATDNDGNVQSPGTAVSFSIDNTAPSVTAPMRQRASSTARTRPYFDNEPVTLTEAATDSGSGVHSVSYYFCEGSSGSCTSGTPWVFIGSSTTSSGNFAVTWNTPLPADDPYQIVATATDNAGNTSGSSPSTLLWPSTPQRQRCLSQELTGTHDEPLSTFATQADKRERSALHAAATATEEDRFVGVLTAIFFALALFERASGQEWTGDDGSTRGLLNHEPSEGVKACRPRRLRRARIGLSATPRRRCAGGVYRSSPPRLPPQRRRSRNVEHERRSLGLRDREQRHSAAGTLDLRDADWRRWCGGGARRAATAAAYGGNGGTGAQVVTIRLTRSPDTIYVDIGCGGGAGAPREHPPLAELPVAVTPLEGSEEQVAPSNGGGGGQPVVVRLLSSRYVFFVHNVGRHRRWWRGWRGRMWCQRQRLRKCCRWWRWCRRRYERRNGFR